MAQMMAHLLLIMRAKKLYFFFRYSLEVFGMELLHDSSGLEGSLDYQLKRLEEKIDTSKPIALMQDIQRLNKEISHFKDVEAVTKTIVSSIKEQEKTIKKLEERTRDKFTEMTSQIKATEAMVADKYKDLLSKINDINSRIDKLEKKIDFAVRELKSEARKTSFLRKLLWLD